MLDKARALQVDCVAYDLEDSVSPSLKATARAMVRRHLSGARASGIGENAVRINAVDTGLALADLTELV
jgi:citrate lyase subunit beta-like protein